jgi:hypothetical protein
MENIIEFRNDLPAVNQYPRHIVSPTAPSPCCMGGMERIGDAQSDEAGQFYYTRCPVCGYSVRRFFAPSLTRVNEQAQQIRRKLAGMNLGAGPTKRRTREEIDQEMAAAERPLRIASSRPRSSRKSAAA